MRVVRANRTTVWIQQYGSYEDREWVYPKGLYAVGDIKACMEQALERFWSMRQRRNKLPQNRCFANTIRVTASCSNGTL